MYGSDWFEHARMLAAMFRIKQTSYKADMILVMYLVSVAHLTLFVVRLQINFSIMEPLGLNSTL